MALPSIPLRKSTNLVEAVALLRAIQTNCYSDTQPIGATSPEDKRNAYVLWATTTEGRLRSILSTKEASGFFEGPRHRDICSMTPGSQLLSLISAEVNTHAERFGALADEFDMTRRLFEHAGTCIVPDTSFYIEHAKKMEDFDYHIFLQEAGPVRVLIPMVVVDELDGLKRASSSKIRWRAGYSLAVIDRVISEPPWPGVFSPSQHMPPRGEVTFQIVFDHRGHRRMPISDDEIIDRCLVCQPFVGNLTVITYDTGQSNRARAAGLRVKKLSHDLGQEPDT